jgi:anthranilate synthase/aminodeoxychorismate synthase-like glutamine amidotransferase
MTVIRAVGASDERPAAARVLLVDNYDSFTYNLAHLFCEAGADVDVRRHDAIGEDEAEALHPTHLVISPGPGRPAEAGVSAALIRRFAGRIPVLGVCLGHQCIVETFGGRVEHAARLMHGKVGSVRQVAPDPLLDELPEPFPAGRYHSLAAVPPVPDEIEVTALDADGEIMAVRHRTLAGLHGLQFHPESILTPGGAVIAARFLALGAAA